jgi:hypothetical protein
MISNEWWDTGEVAVYLKKTDPSGKPRESAVHMLLCKDPTFPRPYKIGSRSNLFDPAEIRAWVRARPRSQAELKAPKKSKRGRPAKAVAP